MNSPISLDPQADWIDRYDALATSCDRWRAQRIVTLDTEFVRERTFFPALGLVQVAAGTPDDPEIALIDVVAIDDLGPLADVLEDPDVIKVMHAPGEDMVAFHHRLDALPAPLFDTQTAAAMAGYGWALGLGALVEAQHGVALPKGAQRTNWLRRPLSDEQLRYAALDVAYLPAIHRRLRHELRALGRLAWAFEDSARHDDIDRQLPEPEDAWRKVKGGGRVPAAGRGVLEALAAWREETARARDLPRGFIVPDAALTALAHRRPSRLRDLDGVQGLSPNAKRRYGARLVEVIRHAPPSTNTPPRRPAYDPRPLVRALQKTVAARATELDVPNELLAARKTLESLLRRVDADDEEPLPSALRGWRAEVIGHALTEHARALLAS